MLELLFSQSSSSSKLHQILRFFLKDDFLGQHLDLLDVCALLMIFCIRIDLNAIAIFANILSPAAAAVVFSGSEIVDRKKTQKYFTFELNFVHSFQVHLCEADPLIDNGSSFHSSFGRKTVVVKSLWKGVSQQKR